MQVCELCGEGRVKGVKQTFKVYAHDHCLEDHLLNRYYRSGDVTQKLDAAGAPIYAKEGYNRHARSGYRDWTMYM